MSSEHDNYPYKYNFAPDNVYGHVLQLLKNYQYSEDEVHLDLGCGFGTIAEPLTSELSTKYIGIDSNSIPIQHLQDKGFESYQFAFGSHDRNLEFIKHILQGRIVASITAIDLLEHLYAPEEFLKTLKIISHEFNAPVVLSIPNFGHDDILLKLFCDRLDITETGLLDKNHVNLFTEKRLISLCKEFGLHEAGKNDIILEISDQHFPKDLLTLTPKSSLNQIIRNLREDINNNGNVYQFVRLFLPGPVSQREDVISKRPFLSIIIRTVGSRIGALKEVLLCLTGQRSTDFEVLIMGHNLSKDQSTSVEKVIKETPEWIREKIRLIKINGGNRSRPLNVGFSEANGHYISILDDDDLVFGNWVETFQKLSKDNYGNILRTISAKQECLTVKTRFSNKSARAISSFDLYADEFNLLEMFHHNECPGLCLAFPRSIFQDFGLRFDESLNTTEDWDFTMRSAFICGVANTPEVTNIYRWWVDGGTSQEHHSKQEWIENNQYVRRKLNSKYVILPPGYVKTIVDYVSLSNKKKKESKIQKKRKLARTLLNSNSWRATKPLRWFKPLMGKDTRIPNLNTASEAQLDTLIKNIQNSKSWKMTSFLRRARRKE